MTTAASSPSLRRSLDLTQFSATVWNNANERVWARNNVFSSRGFPLDCVADLYESTGCCSGAWNARIVVYYDGSEIRERTVQEEYGFCNVCCCMLDMKHLQVVNAIRSTIRQEACNHWQSTCPDSVVPAELQDPFAQGQAFVSRIQREVRSNVSDPERRRRNEIAGAYAPLLSTTTTSSFQVPYMINGERLSQ